MLSDIQILISPLVSFGHCVVWYTDSDYPLVSFGHCVVWYTDSDCPFGIFWSLCCLIYRFWLSLWYLLVIVLSDIQILIAPLVSFGHCVVWYTDSDFPFGIFWSLCCLIYRFWFPLWYLLVIVLSDIRILITPLVCFGHCVVRYTDSNCPFAIFWSLCCLIYRFWLPLCYFLVIVLSDIRILIVPLLSFGHCVVWYTDSDYPFGIFWSLCCLIYGFWLPRWYLLVIVLSDIQILITPLLSFGHCVVWYTDSDCPFGIFWSLCCLIYGFWFPLWYLLVIVLSDIRFWLPLWYLLVIVLSDIKILISPLVSFGHCVVWYTDSDFPFGIFWSLCCLIYRFWFPLWYLLVIVLSDIQILITLWYLLVIVLSDIQILITLWYLLVIVLSDIQILIAPLVSFGHCVVWYTDSDFPFGIFWSLCCLIYRFWLPFGIFWSLCCLIYGFWLSLWYLLVIVLSDIQILIVPLVSFGHCVVWYTDFDCPFGIFWSLCCLIYRFWFPLWYLLVIVLSDIQILIVPLLSFGHCVFWYTDSDYPFGIFWSLCCLIYRFWLSLWYHLVIVLSDIQILIVPLLSFGHCVVWFTDSDCPFAIFWSLCCLIYGFWFPLWYLLVIVLSDLQILVTPLVSFGHCVVWYTDCPFAPLLSFGHCVVWYTDSDFPFGIFWSLCCLIYRFWLSLSYLLVIVLSDIQIMIVPLLSFGHCVVSYTDSNCPFAIFWSLCCLIYRLRLPLCYLLVIVLSDIQILISPLVSFGHCVVWYTDSGCPFAIFWSLCCLIYRFVFPLWYLLVIMPLCYFLVIVLSDIQILIAPLLFFGHCVVWYTDSDCPFAIFWSLCCLIYRFWLSLWYLLVIVLSDIRILITPLVSFGHCVVRYTDSNYPFAIFWSLCCLIYRFWLPLWYLLVIVLSDIQILIVPLLSFGHCVVWYTDSDFPFGIFWSLCCLIYRFWFPLWYLLVIVLSDIQILISPLVSFGHCVVWYTDSDCPFAIFWSLCFLIYRFWLPLWYLLVIVLSDIQILIVSLVSFGHCVVWYTDSDCPFAIFWSLCCLIYRFWLPLCYLLVIVLSDIRILISPLVSFRHCVVWFTDSDYPFGIFWSLCCLIYWLPLCPFAIVWSLCCLIYRFWFPLWYLLVIVLSDIQILIVPFVSFGHCVVWYTDYDCPFAIFWPLCCLIYGF